MLLWFLAGLGCAVVYGIALVLGETAWNEFKESLFRGREIAVRRHRNVGWLRAGHVVFAFFVLAPTLIGTAAALGANNDGPAEARGFFSVAAVALVTALILWCEWWRRSAKP